MPRAARDVRRRTTTAAPSLAAQRPNAAWTSVVWNQLTSAKAPAWRQGGANNWARVPVKAMESMTARRALPRTARERVAQIAGDRNAHRIREQVRGQWPEATDEQFADAFQEALAEATSDCRGRSEGEVYQWLRVATQRKVGRTVQRERRQVLGTDDTVSIDARDSDGETPEELVLERSGREDCARLSAAVLETLSDAQVRVAALHGRGYERIEIASQLGMTPRMVKRTMEGILARGRDELARLAGSGCAFGGPLVSRYAFGLASTKDARRAQLHLAGCPDCGAMYERLDVWRESVAAITPFPAVEAIEPGTVEHSLHHASHGVARVREHLSDAAGQLKQHLSTVAVRTNDPTPLAGARPGAAAAAIAGCLAIGTGATYCVERGASPVSALSSLVAPAEAEKPPDPPMKRRQRTRSAPPVAVTPTAPPATTPPATTTETKPASQTAQPKQEPAPLPPAPEDEFEPSSPTGGSSSASSQSTPSVERKPAPVPENSPPEFGGP